MEKIYVRLIGESSTGYCAVSANRIRDGIWLLNNPIEYEPKAGFLEFLPNSFVLVEERFANEMPTEWFTNEFSIMIAVKQFQVQQVHIPLLADSSTRYAITQAIKIKDDICLLLSSDNYNPIVEKWAFLPRNYVMAEKQFINGVMSLVAVKQLVNYEVYIELLDEGTVVYRPTNASKIRDNIYLLHSMDNYNPDDEIWQFLPGSYVITEQKKLRTGKVLVAVKQLSELS